MNNRYFNTVNQPAMVNYNMGSGVPGSYDNLRLENKNGCGWRKTPCNVPLKKGKFFVPQGTPLPLKNEMQFMTLPENSMFYFDKNVASPACCPSTFSTSTGCVCTTEQQRNLIAAQRGNNKNHYDDSF